MSLLNISPPARDALLGMGIEQEASSTLGLRGVGLPLPRSVLGAPSR